MGVGEGHGRGKGEDTATNVAAGSGVAIALTICFFCVGIPVIFVGVVFIIVFPGSSLWSAGLAMIILSVLFIIGGIVMVVLICTGCFSKGKVAQQPGAIHARGTVVVTNTQIQPGTYGMAGQQPVYGYQQPAGYSMAQPPAYSQAPPDYKPPTEGSGLPGETSQSAVGQTPQYGAGQTPQPGAPQTEDPAYPPNTTAAPY